MEIEFDKEIDAILRSAAKGSSSAILTSQHLDADEISSFAENVLPANARMRAMEHLADCNRCRKILVEISAFAEDETPSEIVHVAEIKTEIPWYKKLFVFPNLAYSMGALCLVFAGIIGFSVFQSRNSLDSIASVAEKPQNAKGASSDGLEGFREVPNSNSAANISNESALVANTVANSNAGVASQSNIQKDEMQNSAVAANKATVLPQTSPTAPSVIQPNAPKNQPIERSKSADENAGPSATPAMPVTTAVPPPKPAENKAAGAAISTDGVDSKLAESRKEDNDKQKSKSLNDSAPAVEKDEEITRSAAPSKPSTALKSRENAKKIAKDTKSESIQVSGKTFRKIGGTWFDSAYGSQPQTNVTRGSADYKKLDSGLQNIGNSLGGNVVVVWNGKAYKIQ
jgi:hypothetical protein